MTRHTICRVLLSKRITVIVVININCFYLYIKHTMSIPCVTIFVFSHYEIMMCDGMLLTTTLATFFFQRTFGNCCIHRLVPVTFAYLSELGLRLHLLQFATLGIVSATPTRCHLVAELRLHRLLRGSHDVGALALGTFLEDAGELLRIGLEGRISIPPPPAPPPPPS